MHAVVVINQYQLFKQDKYLNFSTKKMKLDLLAFFIARPLDTDSKVLEGIVDNPNHFILCFHSIYLVLPAVQNSFVTL